LGPRIVILDEVELSDDQLRRLEGLGRLVRHTTNPTGESEIVRRLDSAEVAILGWTALGRQILSQLPGLRLIAVWATGYDYVDVAAANDHGITVTNVPAYAERAVAELTIGLVLALARRIVPADRSVRDGHFSWRGFQGTELAGKVLGVVGVGDTGREVARLGVCLGMEVLSHARTLAREAMHDLRQLNAGRPAAQYEEPAGDGLHAGRLASAPDALEPAQARHGRDDRVEYCPGQMPRVRAPDAASRVFAWAKRSGDPCVS